MAFKEDKIKDLFSSKLNSFEPELPASLWAGIDQLLPNPTPVQPDASSSTQASTTASKSVALKATLVAAGVAASVALGIFLLDEPQVIEMSPAIVEETKKEEKIAVDTLEKTIILAQSDFVAPQKVNKPSLVEETREEEEEVAAPPRKEKTTTIKASTKGLDTKVADKEELPPLALPNLLKKDISLSLRASAGALSENVNDNGGGLLFSKADRSREFIGALREENKDYKLSHDQPISVGLTISKRLSRHFSIETGLMFTYLSSRIRSNSVVALKEEQKFGYLGIPLHINYDFYELGKAKFYLSLGFAMQKDVYGRYTSQLLTDSYSDEQIEESIFGKNNHILYMEPLRIKKNISQSHWQFSTHFNVGASYPIYRKLKIYTSVGGAYYFDAKNEYRTVFSDRKFQLDLNLGLKIDF